MNINSLLFVSFNNSIAYIYNPIDNTTNKISLKLLSNLTTKYNLIICNKNLLGDYIDSNTLNIRVKDILKFYAVVFPVQFAIESINSLAKSLNISISEDLKLQAKTLFSIYNALIAALFNFDCKKQLNIFVINNFMSQNNNWEWYDTINNTLKHVVIKSSEIIKIWKNFSSTDTTIFRSNQVDNNQVIDDKLVIDNLCNFTSKFGGVREAQKDYALTVAKIFSPNKIKNNTLEDEEERILKPNLVFAEAGTGIGKTIGYLSAVFAYIEKNPSSSVVISTYSKALQQQILNEININIPKNDLPIKVTLIKGNQNYVCLLNVEYVLNYINKYTNGNLFLGFILRWLQETVTGDLLGGDFLPWLSNIIPKEFIFNILNKKEECLYNKCVYYKKCFITKVKEQVKNSNIIISNHSLTLLNRFNSKYIIFDEAHSIYHISDEIFSKEISYIKGIYLRNWLIGNTKNRLNSLLLNGFESRIRNVLSYVNIRNNDIDKISKCIDKDGFIVKENNIDINCDLAEYIDLKIEKLVKTLNFSSTFLPTFNCLYNIEINKPQGIFEEFLYNVYNHVLLQNNDLDSFYTKESHPKNLSKGFIDTGSKLLYQLKVMLKVALSLKEVLNTKLNFIGKENKNALKELITSFEINCINIIEEFIELLEDLNINQENYIYRFSIVKEEGVINNIGFFKNYINPLEEFSKKLLPNKLGIAFTSATLFDSENEIISEDNLLDKFGISKNEVEIIGNIRLKSPFDYVNNSKIIILKTDYSKNVSMRNEALLNLFLAAKGGVLALFTSIARLKQHYNILSRNYVLRENSIDVLSQHSHDKHTGSVINLFKENKHSCLLGSDSFRDGIDIPGNSLRMVIFEKVPWMRKNILNKVRKKYYGEKLEIENIRFKLRQAFGRIIRTSEDKGIFVILNPSCPAIFLSAFPKNIEICKVTLEEAIKLSELFLDSYIN